MGQAERASIPNHTLDPTTGFLESRGFAYDFDSDRKLMFIKRLVANGLSIYDTCDELGLSHKTVFKHYRNDPAFKAAMDEARRDYGDRLDGVSKRNAMNPRSVIERIFQLKSLFPDKYTDQKNAGSTVVNLVFDGKMLEDAKKRQDIIDAQLVDPVELPTETLRLGDIDGERTAPPTETRDQRSV